MQLIDSHCHLDDERFAHDRAQVLQRARSGGIALQIVPATSQQRWAGLKQLCDPHADLYPAYGLHPMFMHLHQPQDLVLLGQWIERERPVAVGECGLDFFIRQPDRKAQQRLFEDQLELARQHALPVIIHARRAVEEVINTLRRFPGINGVVHSYAGSLVQAERLIEMGFLLGFGGPVTHPRARRLRALVGELPLTSILLESDAPDQPDREHAGARNEPAYLGIILQTLASLRGESASTIAAATTANARRLFRLPG